ncbi:MAG: hypothetical protein SCK28_07235 [Bacillota bacterium]|nr:hypothetical protein [Bacillota bacterium]
MTFFVNSSRHEQIKNYVKLITDICISEGFISLKAELESYYKENGKEQASMQAFQDALYAILAEEDIEYLNQRAY